MNSKISLSILVSSILSIGFVGCSSSSTPSSSSPSSSTGTGYYVDSAVSGINYTCGGQTGITEVDGKFTYELNKECTFSVGDITLRKVSKDDLGSKNVTIIENNATVARLLQTMDNDGNASNGINISKKMRDALKQNGISDAQDINSIYNNIIGNTEGYYGHLVTETEATDHLQTTLKAILAGKTFYAVTEPGSTFLGIPVTSNDTGYIIPFSFNNDLTIINAGTSDATAIRFNGNKLIYISDNTGNYQLIKGKTDKYVKVQTVYVAGSGSIDHMRLYFNQRDAQAYADTIKSGTTGGTTGGTIGGTTGGTTAGYTIVQNSWDIPDKAKGLIIYNGMTSAEADKAAAAIHTANNSYNRRYNSNSELNCNNYGYTYLFNENTDAKGVNAKTYLVSQASFNDMCIEYYYNFGSQSMALFQQ